MKYKCLQLYSNDCGFACAKMLLANFHNDKNYLLVAQPKEDIKYSLLEIEEYLNKQGLETESYYVGDYREIKSFPFMCVFKGETNNHFVIVEKLSNNLAYVFDPVLGERVIPIDLFLSLSNNIVLVVEKVNMKKCENYYAFSMKQYEVWLIFINSLQIFFLFLASFELEKGSNRIFIYLVCFLVIMIFNNLINVRFLKNYDKDEIYRAFTYQINEIEIKEEYVLKRDLFSYYNKFITSLMLSFTLILILMINDYKNIFGILLVLLLLFIENKYFMKNNKKYIERVSNLEEKSTYIDFEKADSLAYRYSHNINIFNVLKILIVFIVICVICLINSNFAPLIYYSITYLLICLEMNKLFAMEKDKLELNRKMHRHQNIFVKKKEIKNEK